jgi:serralysin
VSPKGLNRSDLQKRATMGNIRLEDIKLCVDQTIPGQEPFQYIAQPKSLDLLKSFDEPEQVAILPGKKWTPGRTLRISFLDGDPMVHKKVKDVASGWLNHANIKFDFVGEKNGDIRISFRERGYWSKIGRDAVATPIDKPTMNYEGFTTSTDEDIYNQAVLHEFGHGLGCIHEHQNPEAKIRWNEQIVYEYFAATHGWDKAMVDHNIFKRYSKTITNYSEYDESSIMIYHLPAQLTLDNVPVGKLNTELSQKDKKFIGLWYPR